MDRVKYNNSLNTHGLKKFESSELNLLFYLIKRLNDVGDNEVVLTFSEIKKAINLRAYEKDRFVIFLRTMLKKLLKITFETIELGEDGEITEYTIFNKYSISKKNNTLSIRATKEVIPLINNLTKNFSVIDYNVYLNLQTKYEKEIYRRLRQFNKTKLWRISVDDFKEQLDTPKSYSFSHISDVILKPTIDKLKEIYPTLRYVFLYEKNTGKRGRPKVKTLEFKWDKNYIIVNGEKVNPDTGEIYVESVQNTASIEEIDNTLKEIDNTLKNLSVTEGDALLEWLIKKQEQRKTQSNNYHEWPSDRTKEIMNKRFLKE